MRYNFEGIIKDTGREVGGFVEAQSESHGKLLVEGQGIIPHKLRPDPLPKNVQAKSKSFSTPAVKIVAPGTLLPQNPSYIQNAYAISSGASDATQKVQQLSAGVSRRTKISLRLAVRWLSAKTSHPVIAGIIAGIVVALLIAIATVVWKHFLPEPH